MRAVCLGDRRAKNPHARVNATANHQGIETARLDPGAEVHPASQVVPAPAAALPQRAAEAFRQHDGNLAYVFSEDLAEPGVFHLFEEWVSVRTPDLSSGPPRTS